MAMYQTGTGKERLAAPAAQASARVVQASALGSLGATDWLSLAAAPIFTAMACLTAFGEKTQMICASDQGAFPLTGMATMYLLMSAFHLAPWLRLLGRAESANAKARTSAPSGNDDSRRC